MQKKEIKMGAYGLHQYVVNGTMWLPDDGCVEKVVHIVHGMTEHMGRYESFAEDLTPYGIAVVGFDLRGHGRNSGGLEAATFLSGQKNDDEYGWERSVEDIKRQIEKFQKTFPKAEYYLLGFSLGSFLVRDLIRTFVLKGINGVILAGTGYQPGIVTSVMKMVAKSQNLLKLLHLEHIIKNSTLMERVAEWNGCVLIQQNLRFICKTNL